MGFIWVSLRYLLPRLRLLILLGGEGLRFREEFGVYYSLVRFGAMGSIVRL